MNPIVEEPVITSATVVAFIAAVFVLAVSFGLKITPEQQTAVISVATILAPFAVIWWARRKTTPLVNARDVDGEALTRYDGTPALPEQELLNIEFKR